MRIILLLCISFIFTFSLSADTIYLKKGSPVTGVKVTSENHNTVTYLQNERTLTKKSDDVLSIDYDDSPQGLKNGKNEINKGNYELAIEFIRNSMESGSFPSTAGWLNVHNNFYLAKAYQGWADTDPAQAKLYDLAINLYAQLLKEKNNRFLYNCYFHMAQCYMQQADYGKASDALSKLESEARDSSYWRVAANIWSGKVAMAEEKYSSAVGKFERAKSLAERENEPELQQEANIAIGYAYTKDKKFREAQRHFDGILSKADKADYNLVASVENAVATTLLEEGKIQEARRKAISVILNLYQAEKQRPEALYIAGLCNEKLTKEGDYLKRARTYYEFLRQGYPGNPWTTKAIRQLQKISQQE